jgi:hypothetical protein
MKRSSIMAMLAVGVLAVVCKAGEAPAQGPGRWQDLQLHNTSAVVDSGGILWVKDDAGLRYWDGRRLVEPKVSQMQPAPQYVALMGDPGMGAYALAFSAEEREARAYALGDGEVRFLTDYYRDPSCHGLGLYISRSGMLVNYGVRFIATKQTGEWQRVEMAVGSDPTIVATQHHVVLVGDGAACTVDEKGRISGYAAPELRRADRPSSIEFTVMPGADEKVLIISSDLYYEFNAGTGRLSLLPTPTDEASWPSFLRTEDHRPPMPPPEALHPAWRLPWTPVRGSPLVASNGDIWTAFEEGGIVTRYRDGKLTVYDWRQGLPPAGQGRLLEGAGGRIFLCCSTIYAFLPGQPPAALPPDLALWEEYHTAAGWGIMQDSEGRIWMQRADDPDELSVWDGKAWTGVKVPFDMARFVPTMVDDQGRVLFHGFFGEHVYAVDPNGARSFDDFRAMLQSLVAGGARRFTPVPHVQPCVVLPDGRIWWGNEYFDGSTWTRFNAQDPLGRTFESPAYGVLFYDSRNDSYLRYDRGQFVPVVAGFADRIRLLGRQGMQPFEKALVAQRPGAFLPVLRTPAGEVCLLDRMPDSADAEPPASELGQPLADRQDSAAPGALPVFYLYVNDRVKSWAVGGRCFPVSLAGTPISGWNDFNRQIVADRAGNLWVSSLRRVFMKRTDQFRITAGPAPAQVGASLKLDVSLSEPGLAKGQGRVFWRIGDGSYQGGMEPGTLEITFEQSGNHKVEVIGVDLQGAVTPEPLRLSVRSTVSPPQTRPDGNGPYTVKDVVWKAPVTAVPSAPGMKCTIAYRIDNGEWRTAEGGLARTGGIELGRHAAEFAAQQEDGLRDKSPVRVEFDYKPDYDFIVDSRMDALGSDDAETARRAMEEIGSAGPGVLPVLERKARQAADARRQADDLRRAIEALNDEPAGGS